MSSTVGSDIYYRRGFKDSLGRVPSQDVPFALILWYVSKTIYLSQGQGKFAIKRSNLFFDQIDLFVPSIIYICDTHSLNIIFLISYFDISTFFLAPFPFQHICYFLIRLHRTAGPSRCLLFTYLQYIFRYYSWLLFYFITYSSKDMGERCVFVIYRHRVK